MGLFICGHGRTSSGGGSSTFSNVIVEQLPEVGESGVVYLLPATDSSEGDQYTEYIYVNNQWEIYGSNIEAFPVEDTRDYEDVFDE